MPPSCGKWEFNGLQERVASVTAHHHFSILHFKLNVSQTLPSDSPTWPVLPESFKLFLLHPLSLYCCCTLILISNYDHKVCGSV